MNYLKIMITLIVLLNLDVSNAKIFLGSGFTSNFSGRAIPVLYTGFETQNYGVDFISSGVSSEYYYHNAYTTSLYGLKSFGDFLTGDLNAGFGLFLSYQIRHFKSENLTAKDFIYGPQVLIDLEVFKYLHIRMSHSFGISNFNHPTALYFKDINRILFYLKF